MLETDDTPVRVRMRMFVMAVVVVMVMVMMMIVVRVPIVARVVVLRFVVVRVNDLEDDGFASLQIDEPSLGLKRAAARCTHSSHLHLFDLDLVTAEPLHVAATARAGREWLIEHDVTAAITTSRKPRDVVDLELRAFDDRALAAQVETEPDRIGQDERVLTDLEQHPRHPSFARAVGDDLDDLLSDTQFVHVTLAFR